MKRRIKIIVAFMFFIFFLNNVPKPEEEPVIIGDDVNETVSICSFESC